MISLSQKKVLIDFSSYENFVSSYAIINHTSFDWIVNSGAIEHVTKDRVGFVKYHRLPVENLGTIYGEWS